MSGAGLVPANRVPSPAPFTSQECRMSDPSHRKQFLTHVSAIVAFVTSLAGLVKALSEIAEGGTSAVLLVNDLLLYTGNSAVCVFTIFVCLVLLLGWLESGQNSSAGTEGPFV